MSVTTPSTSTTPLITPESNHQQDEREFIQWAIAQLRLDFNANSGQDNQELGRLRLTDPDQSYFDGQSEIQLAFSTTAASSPIEPAALRSRFGSWLMDKLQARGAAAPARPNQQPRAVNDIAEALFDAYQVEDGQIHLGGCQLTDYPFLRLSFASIDDDSTHIQHVFVAPDGSSVPDDLVRDLGLLDITPIHDLPPRIDDTTLSALISAGRRIAAKSSSSRDPSAATIDPVATTLIWAKHADGHLKFTIGEASATLAFSGWAKLLKSQPFLCARSGASTYHLAATDDGQIEAWEQIATCQQSGRRVLKQELVQCSVTDQQVLGEFTENCPVSGLPALRDEFITCSVCQQRVSRAVISESGCAACTNLSKVKKDDPRLVWIFGEHPGLELWNRWQLAETEHVYIACAGALLKRILVVVDKETLAVQYLATANPMSHGWTPVNDEAQAQLLD